MHRQNYLRVILRLHLALELPGGFIKMQIARPQPRFLIQVRVGGGVRGGKNLLYMFPGDAAAGDPGTSL